MSSAGIAVSRFRNEHPHFAEKSILIYLSLPGSSVLPMRVLDSDSIASIKLRIQILNGSVTKNQELVFDGRELARNDWLVRDYGLSDGNVLHLVIRRSDLRLIKNDKDFVQICESWIEPLIVNPEIALSPFLRELIGEAYAGLEKGNKPVLSSEGSGGVYFMRDESGCKNVAVFKPIDEEPMAENNPRGLPLSLDGEGLKRGSRVGEGALREVAAYILDESGFSGVPPTVMVQCFYGGLKIGSLQMFVMNSGSCEDIGPRFFPVEEVHKIALLDLRLANTDRHAGNILICREGIDGKIKLVPIDHGYCLPENFEDCTFDWLFWPQAKQPFDSRSLDYIKRLDAEKDIALLKFYGWELSPECARAFRISTALLKKGTEKGLTPYDIGSILCRENVKRNSKIEEIICRARDAVLPGISEIVFLEAISHAMDDYLEKLIK